MAGRRLPIALLSMLALGGCSAAIDPAPKPKLPDASFPLSAERKANTQDDYALLVKLYGNPDSGISSENDRPRPKVPNRLARYHLADVTVALVPHGCEEAFDSAMRSLAGSTESAKSGLRQLAPCNAADQGWTIVGYLDSAKQLPLDVTAATLKLDGIHERRTAAPLWEPQAAQ
jgi:hypothetical protein